MRQLNLGRRTGNSYNPPEDYCSRAVMLTWSLDMLTKVQSVSCHFHQFAQQKQWWADLLQEQHAEGVQGFQVLGELAESLVEACNGLQFLPAHVIMDRGMI